MGVLCIQTTTKLQIPVNPRLNQVNLPSDLADIPHVVSEVWTSEIPSIALSLSYMFVCPKILFRSLYPTRFFLSLLFDRFSYVEPPHQVQVRPVLSGHGPRTQDSGPGRTGGFRLIRGSRLIRWVQADQGAQVSGRTSVSRLIRWVQADLGAQVGPA